MMARPTPIQPVPLSKRDREFEELLSAAYENLRLQELKLSKPIPLGSSRET